MEEKEIKEEKIKEEKVSNIRRYFLCLKKGWLIIAILVIIGFLTGFIIANKTFHEPYLVSNYAKLDFRYKEEISFDYNNIIKEDNINRCKKIKKSLETGKPVSTYQYVKIDDISISKTDTGYQILAKKDSFNVGKDNAYSDAAAKGFLKHLVLLMLITDEEIEAYNESEEMGHSVFLKFDNDYYKANSLDNDSKLNILYSNPDAVNLNIEARNNYYIIWSLSSLAVGLVIALVFIFIFVDKLDLSIKKEYDNKTIYRHPFHISFFYSSLESFNNVKSLVFMATLLGLVLVCKFIPIPSGFGQLGLGFSYLFLGIACMLFGPYPALVIGVFSDVLGYVIRPDGPFFLGYTFQAALACFFYALCFYKSYITFTRCLVARVLVNFICNVLIGSWCNAVMYSLSPDAAMTYLLTISLPKNIVYLLPQSLLLYLVLKAVAMPLYHLNLVDERIATSYSFF